MGQESFWDRYRRTAPRVAGQAMGTVGAGLGALAYPPATALAGTRLGGMYDWLKEQAMSLGAPGGSPYGGGMPVAPGMAVPAVGPGPSPAPVGPQMGPTPAPQNLGGMSPGGPMAGLPPWDFSKGIGQMFESDVPPNARTKTEQDAPIKFAWGAAEPEAYSAGETQILRMKGAPGARGGFMGAEPVAGGMAAGGFGPSQTDWSKVANPMGFEAFREQPAIEEQRRFMEDPMWREREAADIQMERDVGVGRGIASAQADIVAAQQEAKLNQYLDIVVAQAQDQRRADGQPLMTEEEIVEFRDKQKAAMLAGAYMGGGMGGGMMMP